MCLCCGPLRKIAFLSSTLKRPRGSPTRGTHSGLINISWTGTTRRPVIVVGPFALKFARNARGRRCNKREADLYRSSSPKGRILLCPVQWISPYGFLLVMSAAKPLSCPLTLDEYLSIGSEWHLHGDDDCPFEPAQSNWGWYDGRRVAVDYSSNVDD
jgi:hypothetical protein